jgi:hypothetical protein
MGEWTPVKPWVWRPEIWALIITRTPDGITPNGGPDYNLNDSTRWKFRRQPKWQPNDKQDYNPCRWQSNPDDIRNYNQPGCHLALSSIVCHCHLGRDLALSSGLSYHGTFAKTLDFMKVVKRSLCTLYNYRYAVGQLSIGVKRLKKSLKNAKRS